ncbi:MAG: major capsid protein [Candidatus Roizmanbacteria bacterium]
MSQKASSTIASGWLDLATFAGLDNALYDGPEVRSIHTKEIQPSAFFTRLSVPLSKSGQVDGAIYTFAKTADFAGNVHWEFTTPDITVKSGSQATYRIAFTRNLGHYVAVGGYSLQVNDIPLVNVDAIAMDFFSEANYIAGKYEGYMAMIGNISTAVEFSSHLPPQTIKKPLHELWFCQNSNPVPEEALPLCQLKSNTMTIKAEFVSSLEDVIRVQQLVSSVWTNVNARSINLTDIVDVVGGSLAMPMPELWCEYVMVMEDERKFLKAKPRDICISQIQAVTGAKVSPGTVRQDFRLSKPIRYHMFGARNASGTAIRSFGNYSTNPSDPAAGLNPCRKVTLWYDNAPRSQLIDAARYADLEFLYHADRVPTTKGIHLLPYCYKTSSREIDGSVNYSKLNTALEIDIAETSTNTDDTVTTGSDYVLEIRSQSLQVIHVEGGAMSFPSY